jgi:hypothetical protein
MTKYIAEKTRLHAFMKQYTIFTPNWLNIKSLLSIYSMFWVDFVDTPHSSSKVIENVRNWNFWYLWYKVKQKTLNSFEFWDNTFTIQPNDTMKDWETRKEKKIKSEYNEWLSDYSIYTVEKDWKKNWWMVHSKDWEINYSTFERPLPLQSWKKSENRRAVNNWKVNYAEQVSKPHIFSWSFTMTDAKWNNPWISLMNGTLRNYSEIPTSKDWICFFKNWIMKIVNKREKFNWSDIWVTSWELQSAKEYISSLPQELSDTISSKLDASYALNIYENVHDNFLFFELLQFLKMSVATVSLQVHDWAIQVVEKLPKEHSRYFVTLQDGWYIIAEVFADSLTAIKTIMKYVSEDLEWNKKVDDIVLMDTGIFSKGSLSWKDVSITWWNPPYNIIIME